MKTNLATLLKKHEEVLEEARAIDAKAEDEDRNLDANEQEKFNTLMTEAHDLAERIRRKQSVDGAQLPAGNEEIRKALGIEEEERGISGEDGDPQRKAFRDFTDYMRAIAEKSPELRDLEMGGGGSGGTYLVPDEFYNEIFALDPLAEVVRPRAMILPAGDNPDAKIHLPTFTQSTGGFAGGVSSTNEAENTAYSGGSDPAFNEVTLEPAKRIYDVDVSNELLRNAPALAAFLRRVFRWHYMDLNDYHFIVGSGTDQPKGVANADCGIEVSRNTASSILFEDIAGMYAKIYDVNNAVWIANVDTRGDLIDLKDSSGNRLYWPGDKTRALGPTFYGIPILFTGNGATIGTKGDLILANLQYYVIKDGSGPFIGMSEHAGWKADQTNFRLVWHVDADMWPQASITTNSGATVSPVVHLDTNTA